MSYLKNISILPINPIFLKKLALYILSILLTLTVSAQYYLTGEITDQKNQPLQNAKIVLHSTGRIYFSGVSGGFGLEISNPADTLTISLEGYETKKVPVRASLFQALQLKVIPGNASHNRPKLISITKDLKRENKFRWQVNDESYFQLVENEFADADKYPNTGFSLNVNKSSYSNIRRFLNTNSTVPPDAVRTEELLNYFNLCYKEPEPGKMFNFQSQLTSCPWNPQKQLLHLNITAKRLDMERFPPSNFVFLIDASGSMDMPNRLPLLKAAFQMLVKNLRDKDTVSIVTYGGTVGVWLQPTGGAEKEKIIKSIEQLTAAGDTPGESAIMAAYKVAERTFIKGGNNRVILATDGDFNVGETSEKALEDLITKERQTGVYLTCLGVGMGNYKDSKLEVLAKRGNGNFAYLDDIFEAEKVLVKEITQTFYAVADDVFMNVQFNPALVRKYRLVGFDNKKNAMADSSGDLEGGEIGSGSSVMAVFEILPEDSAQFSAANMNEIAQIDLRYSLCGDTLQQHLRYSCPRNYVEFNKADKELQFGTALVMFALKLKQSKYMKDVDWTDIEIIANNAADTSNYLQNEFLQLITKAKKIYYSKKGKRKKDKGGDEE